MDFSVLNLRPGIVVYFSADSIHDKEESEYITRLQTYSMRHGLKFEVMAPLAPEHNGVTVSRLFNLGNINGNSYVFISGIRSFYSRKASLGSFFDKLIDVTDWSQGDIDVTDYYGFLLELDECCQSTDKCCDLNDARLLESLIEIEEDTDNVRPCFSLMRDNQSFDEPLLDSFDSVQELSKMDELQISTDSIKVDIDREEKEESSILRRELREFERERRAMLRKIGLIVSEYVMKYQEMPVLDEILGDMECKFLISSDMKSSVVINGNLDIIFPEFDEMKLRLTPLCRTLYILFLLHPEGIVLKEIENYKQEMLDIHHIVKPTLNSKTADNSISDMCSPFSESLLQKISMIKRNVRSQLLNPELVDYYSIAGKRGSSYTLPAAAKLRSIPKVLHF